MACEIVWWNNLWRLLYGIVALFIRKKWHALYDVNACENHYPGKWQAMHDANACENYIAIILWQQSPCFKCMWNHQIDLNRLHSELYIFPSTIICVWFYGSMGNDIVLHYQGRIQDLKLGVAQMDWKIWKPEVGGWGWLGGGGWGVGGGWVGWGVFYFFFLSSTLPQIDPDTAYVVCISVSLGFPYMVSVFPCFPYMVSICPYFLIW